MTDLLLQQFKNPNIEILDLFTRYKDRLRVKCKKCGYEWSMLPYNIKKGRGCPICSHRMHKTHNQFVTEMININEDIIILSEYTQAQAKVKCQCKICGHIWEAKATHLLCGHGCSVCRQSGGERTIRSYLNNHNIEFIQQYTLDDLRGVGGGKLRVDFYLSQYNLFIEYQGEQHYRPNGYMGGKEKFEYQRTNDEIKRNYAKEHNYNYLEITYKDNIIETLDTYFKCVTTAGCI